ncbi:MAG: transposase [Patescibacteria group bacterium]|nr:transposase [Patescibacteria group bacterium]
MRKTKFQNKYYYHIFNRGVDKRKIFASEKDYLRFLASLKEFNQIETIDSLYRQDQLRRKARKETKSLRLHCNRSSLVSFITYCFNPNHYHFLIKQIADKGIEKFMHKLGLGYTRYFNNKNNRSGSLFQGIYQAVPIKTDAQLLYVSAYINGNPEIHKISKADKWPWSSYLDYLGKQKDYFYG